MLLKDKKIMITGGATGIGRACARRFAEEGASFIMIVDLNIQAAKQVADDIERFYGCVCIAVQADVTNEEEIIAAFNSYTQMESRLDVLLNCAGIGRIIPMEELRCEQWNLTMDVNARAAFLFARQALSIMKPQRYGRIINMASQAGKSGGIMIGMDYAASKAALLNLTKSLAKYAAPYAVTVNSIAPGLIATGMTTDFGYRDDMVPLGHIGTPEEVANATLFVASDLSSYVTGACIDVNGGVSMW